MTITNQEEINAGMFGKCCGSFTDDQGVLYYMYRDDSGNVTTITANYIIVPPTANPMVQTATPMVPTATPVVSEIVPPVVCMFIPQTSGGAAATATLDQKGKSPTIKGCSLGDKCLDKDDPTKICIHKQCESVCTKGQWLKCFNSHRHKNICPQEGICPQGGKCPNKDDPERTCIHPVCLNTDIHTTRNQQVKCKHGGHILMSL